MNKIVFLQDARSFFTERASKCVMDTRDSDLGDDSMVSGVVCTVNCGRYVTNSDGVFAKKWEKR